MKNKQTRQQKTKDGNYKKVKKSVDKFLKADRKITFTGISEDTKISNEEGVSTTTLYKRKDLKEMIRRAQAKQNGVNPAPNKDADANLRFANEALTAKNSENEERIKQQKSIIENQNGELVLAKEDINILIKELKKHNISLPELNKL